MLRDDLLLKVVVLDIFLLGLTVIIPKSGIPRGLINFSVRGS